MKLTRTALAAAALTLLLLLPVGADAKYGLSESEIRTVQTRLKAWGYYSGEVDGIYGSGTTEAVRYFQRTNDLAADGIVGGKTAEKLGMTLSGAPKDNVSSDAYLLARVVYGEARGEPYAGKVAVAAVVLNRVRDPGFPGTIAGVVYQKGAFSIVADGQINLMPDSEALSAALDAMNGRDPTGGCLFYYNPEKSSSSYMSSKPVTAVIGKHYFMY